MKYERLGLADGEKLKAEHIGHMEDAIADNRDRILNTDTAFVNAYPIVLTDATNQSLRGLNLYGRTTQAGVPSADTPIDLVSSGDDGVITVKLFGKNMLPNNALPQVAKGLTLTVNDDGSIHIKGTAEAAVYFTVCKPFEAHTGRYYTISSNVVSTQAYLYIETVSMNKSIYSKASGVLSANAGTQAGAITFMLTQDEQLNIHLYVKSGATIDETFYPMIALVDDAVYEPYVAQALTVDIPGGLLGIQADIGNVVDEYGQPWICDEVDVLGGEIIRRLAKIESYAGEEVGDVFMSSTGGLDAGATVVYPLAVETRMPLSDDIVNAYAKLTTIAGNTTVVNDGGAGMRIGYQYDAKKHIDSKKFDYASYGLPIVYLSGNTFWMDKDNAVTMRYTYGNLSGNCTVKWQGTSSLAFPKKNYSIKFDTAFEAKDGWGEHKDYCLKADWVDFSHARNVVSAKLWRGFGRNNSNIAKFHELPNCGAIDGFPCMVVINGEYQGLYSFTIPKKPWLFGLDETNLNACIVGCCGDSDSTLFKSESLIDDINFEFEYLPEGADAAALTASFQKIFQALEVWNANPTWTNLFNEEFGVAAYLDTASVIAYYIHCALTCNRDGIGKNMLFVTTDGKKWHMSPYDMDGTFGMSPLGGDVYTIKYQTFSAYAALHGIFNAIRTSGIDRLKATYTNARLYWMDEETVLNEFYRYLIQIPKACLDEEVRLWPGIPGTNINNMTQISNYYRMRMAQLDAEMEALGTTA